MSVQTDTSLLSNNLEKELILYGLSADTSRVYLLLLAHGYLSALSISRALHIGRTKVYRLLDQLQAQSLVEYRLDDRGMKFGAKHPSQLARLLDQQQASINQLQQQLPDLLPHLQSLMHTTSDTSKVLYYEGRSGLQQLSYNITRATDMVRVYEMEHLSDFLPADFSELIRTELVQRHIQTRDLTNKKSFGGFTNVSELIEHYSQFRYIDPRQLTINFEVLIYNDVYATYTYKGDTVFGIEIYNQQLADMQKQLYDFIWQQAQPMRFTDAHGAAVFAH